MLAHPGGQRDSPAGIVAGHWIGDLDKGLGGVSKQRMLTRAAERVPEIGVAPQL